MQETRVVEDILVIPEAGIRTLSHNQLTVFDEAEGPHLSQTTESGPEVCFNA